MEILITLLCLFVFVLGILIFDVILRLNALRDKVDKLINVERLKDQVNKLEVNMSTIRDYEYKGGGSPQPSEPPPKTKKGKGGGR